jgi:hypothetical protein
MRLALVTLLVALPLLTSAAQGQPNPADARTLQTCLKSKEDKLGRDCIGIIADPCIASTDGNLEQSKACAARELAVWQAELGAALRKVKRGNFKEIDRAVAKSQEAWRASLGELCPVFARIDPGMLPGNDAYCLLQETASRTLLMRRLGDAVNEH